MATLDPSDAHVQSVLQMLDFGKDPVPEAANTVSLAQLPPGMTIQQYQQMAKPASQNGAPAPKSPPSGPQSVKTVSQPGQIVQPAAQQIQLTSVPQMQQMTAGGGVQYAAVQGPNGVMQLVPIQMQMQQQPVQFMQVPQGMQVMQLSNGQAIPIPGGGQSVQFAMAQPGVQSMQFSGAQQFQLAALQQQAQMVQATQQQPPMQQQQQQPMQAGMQTLQAQPMSMQQAQATAQAQQQQQQQQAQQLAQQQAQQLAQQQVQQLAQQQAQQLAQMRLAQPQFVQVPQQMVSPQFAQLPAGFAASQPTSYMVQTPQGLAVMQIPQTQATQMTPAQMQQLMAGRFPVANTIVPQAIQPQQAPQPKGHKGKAAAPVQPLPKKADPIPPTKLNPNATAFVPKAPSAKSPTNGPLPASTTSIACPFCAETPITTRNVLRAHVKAKHTEALPHDLSTPASTISGDLAPFREAVEKQIAAMGSGSCSCLDLHAHCQEHMADLLASEQDNHAGQFFSDILKAHGFHVFTYTESQIEELKILPTVAEPWDPRVAIASLPLNQAVAEDVKRSTEA